MRTLTEFLGWVQTLYYRFHGVIGKNTRILGYAWITPRERVKIGDNCTINHGCVINANKGKIIIGDNVSLSPYCRVYTSGLTRDHPREHIKGKQVVIEDNVWLADGVKVMPGVTIRKGATVYPGAIVTRDVREKQILKNHALTNDGKMKVFKKRK